MLVQYFRILGCTSDLGNYCNIVLTPGFNYNLLLILLSSRLIKFMQAMIYTLYVAYRGAFLLLIKVTPLFKVRVDNEQLRINLPAHSYSNCMFV